MTTEDDGSPLAGSAVRAQIGGDYTLLGPDAAAAGGIAYVNTFGIDYFGPALIFAGSLSGGNPRDVASVVSHEVGHTLGLVSLWLFGWKRPAVCFVFFSASSSLLAFVVVDCAADPVAS